MKSPVKFAHVHRLIGITVMIAFIMTGLNVPLAQSQEFRLPAPGVMVHLSPEFNFAHLRGMAIRKDDPFRIDFFINRGDQALSDTQKKSQYRELVKYFLAALATPDEDQWVNLSPYEKNRIIADDFARTSMGRDLLAEDYMLKQITASLIYPEEKIGKKFWARIYGQAQKQFGTTNIPVNTFNKVWIVPRKAVVYENARSGIVYIVESQLKVMLEQDYLALKKSTVIASRPRNNSTSSLGSQIVRAIVIPELTREVNEGKNFARLRQIYSAMILATWYKKALKNGILAKIYTDKGKVKGIDQDPALNEIIYQRYLKAFKKGVFNYIKEDFDPVTQESIPRKYFSGGFSRMETRNTLEPAMIVIQNPAQLSSQARDHFVNEAMLNQIDEVDTNFKINGNNKSTTLRDFNNAMLSIRNLTFGLGKVALITLIITQLCCSNSKVLSPEAQKLLNIESQIYGITLKESPEKGLNDIVMTYFRNNGNDLFSRFDDFPNLKRLLLNIKIEKSAHPYQAIVQIVKKRVAELKSTNSQDELDELSKEVVLYLQRMVVSMLNANSPNYVSGQRSVAKLIFGIDGRHLYNCVSISAFAVMVGREMGINVYEEEVKRGEDGTRYPVMENGQWVGHVDNVLKSNLGLVHLDQGAETNPLVVEVPESFADIIRDQQAEKVYGDYKISKANLMHDLEGADTLFKNGEYFQAGKKYAVIADKASKEYKRFQGKYFPKGLVHDDDQTLATSNELLEELNNISETARKNAEASKHNAPIGKGAINTPQDMDSYNNLINKINPLNSQANTAFGNQNYEEAARLYGRVIGLIDQDINKDRLSKARSIARNNQIAALNNLMVAQYNSLIKEYNQYLKVPDSTARRKGMENIFNESSKVLGQADMGEDIRKAFGKLRDMAGSLKDKAMNVQSQPLGGIDFNGRNMDLQINGDNGQIALPVDSIAWDNVTILGLLPTIIEIKSVGDWGAF